MEKKVNISTKFVCLIISFFLLCCGVKGDPEEPRTETIILKKKEIKN